MKISENVLNNLVESRDMPAKREKRAQPLAAVETKASSRAGQRRLRQENGILAQRVPTYESPSAKKVFFTAYNFFDQPIRKFELWTEIEGRKVAIWESAPIDRGGQQIEFVSLPPDLNSYYQLFYKVELENGEIVSGKKTYR